MKAKILVFAISLALLLSGMLVTAEQEKDIEGSVEERSEKIDPENIEIHNWYDLNNTRDELDSNYTLMNDLDKHTAGYDELVDTEDGWEPIGTNEDNIFTGTFDGQGHIISDLYIDGDGDWDDPDGLFGFIDDGAVIENVGVVDANVSGRINVGILVGYAIAEYGETIIRNCFTTGTVSGEARVGGITGGENYGGLGSDYRAKINNTYSLAEVYGDSETGGIVGRSDGNGGRIDIYNSMYIGEDPGHNPILGDAGGGATVTNSYYNYDISNVEGDHSEGRTTDEMTWEYDEDIYEDWDFEDTWVYGEHEFIEDPAGNSGYPALRWQEDVRASDLTIDIEGEGSTDPDEGTHTYEQDEEVVVTAEADEDWYFDEWTGDVLEGEEEEDEITIVMDEDKEITAVFEEEDNGDDGGTLTDAEELEALSEYWWLISLIVIGAIIAIVVGAWKRKKTSQEPSEQKQKPQTQQQQTKPPQQQSTPQPPQQQSNTRSARSPPQAEQPPSPSFEEEKNRCPDCGQGMRFIHDYGIWYCDNCQEYK